jgi:uncharacterized protein HemX
MTTKIKLIIATILAALVAYSYLWTYWQGQKTCKSAVLEAQITALEKQLKDEYAQFREQREREMREARAVEEQLRDNEKKYTAGLDALREKYESLRKAGAPTCVVNRDIVRMLNNSRSEPFPTETS